MRARAVPLAVWLAVWVGAAILAHGPARAEGAEPRILLIDGGRSSGWLAGRALDLLGGRLRLLGYRVVGPESGARWGGEVATESRAVEFRLEAPKPERSEAPIRLEVRTEGVPPLQLRGRAARLDYLVSHLALQLAERIGPRPPPGARLLLRDEAVPFPVHRLLGLARLRLQAGARTQARVLLDRAADKAPRLIMLGALLAARDLRLATVGSSPELITAALDRADDARRRSDWSGVIDAALDAIRYGVKPALRWRIGLPTEPRAIWATSDQVWIVFGRTWMQLDALSGELRNRGMGRSSSFASIHGDWLELAAGALSRRTPGGDVRWTLPLPPPLRTRAGVAGAGQIAVWGPSELAWVESSLGSLGESAQRLNTLALGEAGALVKFNAPQRLALLRPGRMHPVWTVALSATVAQARLTGARALIRTPQALFILDLYDGRSVASPPISIPSSAEILGSHGRHAVLRIGERSVAIVDVLAGAVTARMDGPGRALGAYIGGFAVSVAYASGDILHFDPDGLYLGRSSFAGTFRRLFRSPPDAPGPILQSKAELAAMSEVRPGERTDVDLLLQAAEAARKLGRHRDVRVLATHIARLGAAGIVEAERLRAEGLTALQSPEARAAARWARHRADAASVPTLGVPPFRLGANPEPSGTR